MKNYNDKIEQSTLYNADCFDVFQLIPDKSIDAIICDLPYGTTACKWDTVLPLDRLWAEYERVIKDNGAIVLTASQPFTTILIQSNFNLFKYCWYWKKTKPNGFQHSKNRPMTAIEECCVFSKAPMGHVSLLGEKRMKYNPQGIVKNGLRKIDDKKHGRILGARPKQVGKEYESFTNFPSNVLEFSNVTGIKALHPTQKPVALMEYLIKTYTNEGETVLDNTMGSGTTGVACVNTSRQFIGIEKEQQYYNIAVKRIKEAQNQYVIKQTQAL